MNGLNRRHNGRDHGPNSLPGVAIMIRNSERIVSREQFHGTAKNAVTENLAVLIRIVTCLAHADRFQFSHEPHGVRHDSENDDRGDH